MKRGAQIYKIASKAIGNLVSSLKMENEPFYVPVQIEIHFLHKIHTIAVFSFFPFFVRLDLSCRKSTQRFIYF